MSYIGSSGTFLYKKGNTFNKKSYILPNEKKQGMPLFHTINPYGRLKAQYLWLKKIQSNKKIKKIFPEIIRYRKGDNECEYSMKYLYGEKLTDKIEKLWEINKIEDTINKICMLLREDIHTQEIDINDQKSFIEDHIFKLKNRIEILKAIAPNYDKLLSSRTIIINGKTYLNLPGLIVKFMQSQDLEEILSSQLSTMVHGDFHLGNIFITKNNKIVLLDPRGVNSDPIYDISKLSHNTIGLYDFSYKRMFDINVDGLKVDINYIVPSKIITHYKKVDKIINKIVFSTWIKELKDDNQKKEFVLKYIAYNASHCIGASPFQIFDSVYKKNGNDFLALYCVGIYLFNKLFTLAEQNILSLDDIDWSDSPFNIKFNQ